MYEHAPSTKPCLYDVSGIKLVFFEKHQFITDPNYDLMVQKIGFRNFTHPAIAVAVSGSANLQV